MTEQAKEYTAEKRADTVVGDIVSAVFRETDAAENAYEKAQERGYTRDEVMVLLSKDARDRYFPSERVEVEKEGKAMQGAGVGGAVGTAVGAIAGAIVAVGTTVVLPLGGVIIAGPLLFGLAGAGAGGVTGGLVGALVGAGMSEERARVYKTAVEEGGVVLAVRPRNEEDAEWLAATFEESGGKEVYRG